MREVSKGSQRQKMKVQYENPLFLASFSSSLESFCYFCQRDITPVGELFWTKSPQCFFLPNQSTCVFFHRNEARIFFYYLEIQKTRQLIASGSFTSPHSEEEREKLIGWMSQESNPDPLRCQRLAWPWGHSNCQVKKSYKSYIILILQMHRQIPSFAKTFF